MDGILLFDKPAGWTSHDAVDFVRRHVGQKAVGHAGTLDPMATGLLVLLLGKATKRSQEFSGLDKEYTGTLTLGTVTDTLDKEGRILDTRPYEGISEKDVQAAFLELTGTFPQIPPSFSAIKVKGKKLYDLARSGIMVEAEPRMVTVHEFKLTDFSPPLAAFRVKCSKGTYIRSLGDSVGKKLGCGAMLSSLVRTRVGALSLENALTEKIFSSMPSSQIESSLVQK